MKHSNMQSKSYTIGCFAGGMAILILDNVTKFQSQRSPKTLIQVHVHESVSELHSPKTSSQSAHICLK